VARGDRQGDGAAAGGVAKILRDGGGVGAVSGVAGTCGVAVAGWRPRIQPPEDAAILRGVFARRRDVAVHERDGYAAMRALLPPPERRALVLVDPPFERGDEFEMVVKNVVAAWEKFRSGVFVVWYPIKHLAPVRGFFEAVKVSGMRDVVAASFWRRKPEDPKTLNGCGLLVVNPPFGFEAAALPVLQDFVEVFGETGGGCAVERLVDE
jgi:23S rRNA (adenine2030-N6)-methyltransferase